MTGEPIGNASDAIQGVCENCGTRRLGPWCHACGQHEDTAHHSVKRLSVEAIEHLANTDGKVFRTLRLLCLHPGRLTADYLRGRRVPQLAPLQLFFVMLVIFLFVAELTIQVEFEMPTPQQVAQMPGWIRWIMPISAQIQAHGGDFLGLLRQSSELFGVLTVPVAALLLWGLFAPRRLPLYDHLIFSLHSLSFQLILAAIMLVLDNAIGVAGNLLLIAMAVHLFMHMRAVYGGRVVAIVLRMALLGLGTLIAYSGLTVIWFTVAYFGLTMSG
jgi:hypothetical protein